MKSLIWSTLGMVLFSSSVFAAPYKIICERENHDKTRTRLEVLSDLSLVRSTQVDIYGRLGKTQILHEQGKIVAGWNFGAATCKEDYGFYQGSHQKSLRRVTDCQEQVSTTPMVGMHGAQETMFLFEDNTFTYISGYYYNGQIAPTTVHYKDCRIDKGTDPEEVPAMRSDIHVKTFYPQYLACSLEQYVKQEFIISNRLIPVKIDASNSSITFDPKELSSNVCSAKDVMFPQKIALDFEQKSVHRLNSPPRSELQDVQITFEPKRLIDGRIVITSKCSWVHRCGSSGYEERTAIQLQK